MISEEAGDRSGSHGPVVDCRLTLAPWIRDAIRQNNRQIEHVDQLRFSIVCSGTRSSFSPIFIFASNNKTEFNKL